MASTEHSVTTYCNVHLGLPCIKGFVVCSRHPSFRFLLKLLPYWKEFILVIFLGFNSILYLTYFQVERHPIYLISIWENSRGVIYFKLLKLSAIYEMPTIWNMKYLTCIGMQNLYNGNHFGINLDCHDRLRKRPTKFANIDRHRIKQMNWYCHHINMM